MNYKEVVEDLINHLNSIIEDPMRKLHGNFYLEVQQKKDFSISDKEDTLLCIKLWFKDEYKHLIMQSEYHLINKVMNINSCYECFYRQLIRYMLFAKDTSKDGLEDNYGSPVIVIPFNKLMLEGLKIKN